VVRIIVLEKTDVSN